MLVRRRRRRSSTDGTEIVDELGDEVGHVQDRNRLSSSVRVIEVSGLSISVVAFELLHVDSPPLRYPDLWQIIAVPKTLESHQGVRTCC